MRKLFLIFLLIPSLALAIGPHEIVLLVNEDSEDSKTIAAEYAKLRSVPQENIIYLKIPCSNGVPRLMSPDDFMKLIYLPAAKEINKRGINDHALAWVYSADFPTAVNTEPRSSLTGFTFVRGKILSSADIDKAKYISRVFAGPDNPNDKGTSPQSFNTAGNFLGDEMPLPAMMLGVTGTNANTRDEIMQCLRKGAESDSTSPSGTVYLITGTDIRATCRQWQFESVQKELRHLGIACLIQSNFPAGKKDIAGIMMGAAIVNPNQDCGYLPGCMAEHLTSMAGMFENSDQTKLSKWISAGASASAGTVNEPYSAWLKFPHARFFVHYASGCTAIESFYLSIRSPLQILLVGDPLARPWAPKAALKITEQSGDKPASRIYKAEASSKDGTVFIRYLFLLDGKVISTEESCSIDLAGLTAGIHKLRAVATSAGSLKHQAFTEIDIKK